MSTIRFAATIVFCVAYACVAQAQTVVVDDNLTFGAGSIAGQGNHVGTIFQDPAGTDPTSVWFDFSAGNVTAVEWNIDEESDWYLVDFGDVFGFNTVENDQFSPIFTADAPRPPVAVGSDDFYLGVVTGVNFLPPSFTEPNRDVFGWVHLRNNAGSLEFLGSAVAYGSQGIIVGSATAVPEPSTLFVTAFLLTGTACRRRRA